MTFSQLEYERAQTQLEASRRRCREIIRTAGCTDVQRGNAANVINECRSTFHRSFGWHEIVDDEWKDLSSRFFPKFFLDTDLRLPSPFVSWDTGHLRECTPDQLSQFQRDLHLKCIVAMKKCGFNSPWFLLENVNHPWYRLYLDDMPDHFEPWPTEIIPNADPFYLVSEDFSCGLISQHSGPISVFGNPLLALILDDIPKAFIHVLRSDLMENHADPDSPHDA